MAKAKTTKKKKATTKAAECPPETPVPPEILAAGDTDTRPFCGSCGWDAVRQNIEPLRFCDACGADLRRFGFIVP